MQVPLKVEFRNIEPSPALERNIRHRAAKLERFADDIISCRVVVELPHRHKRQGEQFRVILDIEVPGREVAVSRDPGPDDGQTDPFVAVRNAFDAAERRLQDYNGIRRREVKAHDEPAWGRIVELKPGLDFGRIESFDGREIYFHRNSLSNTQFEALTIGQDVQFGEEAGEEGPQARYVRVSGADRVR